jgi:hypothetical protein
LVAPSDCQKVEKTVFQSVGLKARVTAAPKVSRSVDQMDGRWVAR